MGSVSVRGLVFMESCRCGHVRKCTKVRYYLKSYHEMSFIRQREGLEQGRACLRACVGHWHRQDCIPAAGENGRLLKTSSLGL